MTADNTIQLPSLDRTVRIRELTAGDMRAMLLAREGLGEEDPMDPMELLVIGDGLLLSDLTRLTDLTHEDLELLTETDISTLVTAAKKANPRFFGQILATLSRYAAASLNAAAPASSATSSPSSGSDTPTPGSTH